MSDHEEENVEERPNVIPAEAGIQVRVKLDYRVKPDNDISKRPLKTMLDNMLRRLSGTVRENRILVAFILAHFLLFVELFVMLALYYYPRAGDAELFVSSKIFQGLVPYRDFVLEYPPLAMAFFLLPRLLAGAVPGYSFAFGAEMFIADAIVLVIIARQAPRLGYSVFRLLAFYTLLVIGIGPIIATRYDLWPAALMLVGLAAFAGGRTKLAWAAMALNVCAKLYGIFVMPLFVIYHLANRQYRRMVEGIATFAVVSIVLVAPWMIITFSGFLHSMEYHVQRGLHTESTYGTALLVAQLFGKTSVKVDYGFGSWNVYSPLADALAGYSFWVTGAALAALYLMFTWVVLARRKSVLAGRQLEVPDGELVLQFSALIVVAFLLTSKVFSAQYLVWLCPLIPLAARDRLFALALLFFVAGLLTQYIYPYLYAYFLMGNALAVIPEAMRDLVMLAMTVLMIRPRAWTKIITSASR